MQLHYFPGNASLIPHIVLEELGIAYQRVLVDRAVDAHKSPAYLKLNPNGLIPVLVDGDQVLYETGAICLYLADGHPQSALAPALGSAARAQFYKWLMWLGNTLQTTLIAYFYPDRWVDEGNADGAMQVRRHAELKTSGLLAQLDAELARHGGPWFMGGQYTVLDAYVWVLCRWTRGFGSRPAPDYPHLGPYLQRMIARPALQRALANEALAPPWV